MGGWETKLSEANAVVAFPCVLKSLDHSTVPRRERSVSPGSGICAVLETVKERTISGFPVT